MERSAELERAALDLEIVLEANPRDAKAYCLLGAIQERLGQHAKSVAAWTRAHDIAPEDLDIASGLGVALSRAGRHSEAARVSSRRSDRSSPARSRDFTSPTCSTS
jgi:cytochrome c-type biogenesis protein CcmH/NrfG